MPKWVPPLERARETDQENGIVYYVCMFGSWDIVVWKSEKCAKTAD